MKKIILSLIAIVAITSNAVAQDFLSWGVKAGINFATMHDFTTAVKDNSLTSKPDFVGGLFVEVRPISLLGVSAEVLYSGQGFKNTGTFDGVKFKYENTTHLGYINVPILANFYVFRGLAVKAGVQVGFKVSAKTNISIDGVEVESNQGYKTADFAIPVGLSYSFGMGLIIDARYTFGVTDISKESVLGLMEGKSKNSVFTVSLGWRF